ncbi:MAG: TetR/AcrR family transcriptional regulator [Chloroflexota bacterium]
MVDEHSAANDTGGSRRSRRTAARREQIMQAAARIFAEKGFHRTTTREIAEAADVAEGTIYNYFENKDELLVEMINQMGQFSQRRSILDNIEAGDLREFFIEHFASRLSNLQDQSVMVMAVLPEILNTPELRERYKDGTLKQSAALLEHLIQTSIEMGAVRPMDVSLNTRLLIALVYGIMVLHIMEDPIIEEAWQQPRRLAEAMVSMIFDQLEA